MVDFPMCDFCESEYTDLHDRRHHAQTISCHNCTAAHVGGAGACLGSPDDTAILDRAAELLKKGGVIAFKSVGGYNLLADPFNGKAVEKLRQAKNRESKPFAVMFRSLEEIRRYCYVDDVEAKLLQSSARPIILLEHRPSDSEEINRSRFIGSFLPGFAAQYMLLDRISPLIFTSANPSNLPMIKDDAEMLNWFDRVSPLVDAILYNKERSAFVPTTRLHAL